MNSDIQMFGGLITGVMVFVIIVTFIHIHLIKPKNQENNKRNLKVSKTIKAGEEIHIPQGSNLKTILVFMNGLLVSSSQYSMPSMGILVCNFDIEYGSHFTLVNRHNCQLSIIASNEYIEI